MRKKLQRPAYQVHDKFSMPVLAHMRKVAFSDSVVDIHRVMLNSENGRNDLQLIANAQAKRDRKNALRMAKDA